MEDPLPASIIFLSHVYNHHPLLFCFEYLRTSSNVTLPAFCSISVCSWENISVHLLSTSFLGMSYILSAGRIAGLESGAQHYTAPFSWPSNTELSYSVFQKKSCKMMSEGAVSIWYGAGKKQNQSRETKARWWGNMGLGFEREWRRSFFRRASGGFKGFRESRAGRDIYGAGKTVPGNCWKTGLRRFIMLSLSKTKPCNVIGA